VANIALECRISELPDLGGLVSLQELDVSFNTLQALPEGLETLTSLRRLWANNNELTSLPASIRGLVGLSELSVTSNKITELPSEIAQLSCLSRLSASANFISGTKPAFFYCNHLLLLLLYYLLCAPCACACATILLTGRYRLLFSFSACLELNIDLSNLQHLWCLELGHNNLMEFPVSVFEAPGLLQLNLFGITSHPHPPTPPSRSTSGLFSSFTTFSFLFFCFFCRQRAVGGAG
jgi:Leucine-rich repeat (LRR) protein